MPSVASGAACGDDVPLAGAGAAAVGSPAKLASEGLIDGDDGGPLGLIEDGSSSSDIRDAVTPWHAKPYHEQLQLKQASMELALRRVRRRLRETVSDPALGLSYPSFRTCGHHSVVWTHVVLLVGTRCGS